MSKMRKALIIGISGQDGSYLAELLLKKGYEVHGTSRDADLSNFYGLKKLGIFNKVKLHSMSLIDFRSVMQTILQIEPEEIYNLAGQTSVGLSFLQPVETLESISVGTLNILEVLRFHKLPIKFYNACSSECFGDTGGNAANEETPFKPRSPYAVAKSAAFWQVANYREAYNLFSCSGILFNHESPLRAKRFVTKKIIDTACAISHGENLKLELGNISIIRDWGWAPEYCYAMHLILLQDQADDFVISTGTSTSLEEFVNFTFQYFNLDYKKYLVLKKEFIRPTDIGFSLGDSSKAANLLHWVPKVHVNEIIEQMIKNNLSID
ncbi:MAG: GDP-mannose 4,6-dehydratase [Ignavibacteriaceae bacterium]|nr:GDP-mannose 4,6-dehydratase [Ignavibacteriaceae bacterium]